MMSCYTCAISVLTPSLSSQAPSVMAFPATTPTGIMGYGMVSGNLYINQFLALLCLVLSVLAGTVWASEKL